MSIRRTTTPAFGLVAGLAVVSSGMVGVLLSGSPSTTQTVVKACSIQVTAAQSGTSQARLRLRTQALKSAPMNGALVADTTSPSPTASSDPAATSSPTASSTADASPTPTNSATSSPPSSPSPIPTTGSTSSPPSNTPTPTPTPTTSHAARLCLSVQSLNTHRKLRPGGHANYAIWVWLTDGKGGTARIQLSAKPRKLSPHFTVCQPKGHARCAVGGLDAGQKVELRATIAVPKRAAGTRITLTVTGHSPEAAQGATAKFSMWVRAHKAAHGRSHAPSGVPGTPGVGITLPNGLSLAQLSKEFSSGGGLPALPTPVSNAGSAFPEVAPSQGASTGAAAVLPPPRAIPAADVASTRPLALRLIGGQIIGLAMLAAAVLILLAGLAVRKRRPRQSNDPA
jgi:hypothetical protein